MKTLIILIFTITSLFFFSCQNDGEITIKASLPVRTTNSYPDNNENPDSINIDKLSDFTNFYIPIKLLNQFKNNNVSVKLNVITPTKQHKNFTIIAPQSKIVPNNDSKTVNKFLNISFNALLEEGKKRVLIVQIGKLNDPKALNETKTNDANTDLMFIGGAITDIKKGKDYAPIELYPIVNIKGNVISDPGNKDTVAKITVYPAFTNAKGQYPLKLTRNTNSDGLFNLSSIYGIFKKIYNKEYFNLLLTASQGDKIGFSIVGKEYQEPETKTEIFNKESDCYQHYEGDYTKECPNLNTSQFNTQSGNLLPGVNIVSDIKIYSNADLENMPNGIKAAVTAVSSPKFAKKVPLTTDPYNKTYYGNFFISGFNLNKLINKANNDTPEGTIRIYYKLSKSNKINSEDYDEFYLQYTGPFIIYNVNKIIPSLKDKNAQVIQNRLPFFKLYLDKSNSYIPDLSLVDGFNSSDGSFLGVPGLQKLTDNYNITRVEFEDINGENFEKIYQFTKNNNK